MQTFRIIKPSAPLAPYVRYYWILQDDALTPITERTIPAGCIQWVFHKGKQLLSSTRSLLQPSAFVCGQTMHFSDVVSTGKIEMITVVFQPYASQTFLPVPSHKFYDQTVALEDTEDTELSSLSRQVGDTPDNQACLRLIEQFLLKRLTTTCGYNTERMMAVVQRIHIEPQISVPELAETACLSTKQLTRIFTEHIGAAPKEFLRIVRMQRALYLLQLNQALPLAQVAYTCGFSDQSHMIKEFKLFSGYTPTGYLAVCAPYSDYFSSF